MSNLLPPLLLLILLLVLPLRSHQVPVHAKEKGSTRTSVRFLADIAELIAFRYNVFQHLMLGQMLQRLLRHVRRTSGQVDGLGMPVRVAFTPSWSYAPGPGPVRPLVVSMASDFLVRDDDHIVRPSTTVFDLRPPALRPQRPVVDDIDTSRSFLARFAHRAVTSESTTVD